MKTEIEFLDLLDQDLEALALRASTDETERTASTAASPRRRPRLGWGTLVAAALPVLLIAGLIGWLTTGQGASEAPFGQTQQAIASGEAPAAPAATSVPDSAREGAWATGKDQTSAEGEPASTSAEFRDLSKIIRTGQIGLVVANGEFDGNVQAVSRIARSNGGVVFSSEIRRNTRGTMTLRIPASRFDQTMEALRGLGIAVEFERISGQDVTAEYIDLRARLRILKTRRAVLLGLMQDATTTEEILRLHGEIERVQLDIERIQGQLNVLNDQVADSTIKVSLREKDSPEPSVTPKIETPDLSTAWGLGWRGFLQVVSFVIVGLGYLIPIAAIGAVVLLALMAIRRRRPAAS
jgi:hypothetical protein